MAGGTAGGSSGGVSDWMNLTLAGFLALVAPMPHFTQRRRQSSKELAGGITSEVTEAMFLPQPGHWILGKIVIVWVRS